MKGNQGRRMVAFIETYRNIPRPLPSYFIEETLKYKRWFLLTPRKSAAELQN